MGWPPIKSWRKKAFHQHQDDHIANNRALGAGNENGGSNSMYVKVKMEGVAIKRKIDLRLYHSYQTLTDSLISMFAKCKWLCIINIHNQILLLAKQGLIEWLYRP